MAETALATAYVKIVPSFQGFKETIDKEFGGNIGNAATNSGKEFGKRFSTGLKSMVGPALAAFSVGAATKFLSDSVQLASDLTEQGSAVGQVFGKSSTIVQTFAEGAATSLGQSTVQILDAAKSFGIYGKAAGLSATQNAKFSTGFVQLATDLASFNNTSVDEALLALQSGLRGEAEPLRRFGVLLDDATLRNEALKLGLIKTTKDALTPAQKVLAAQAAIYKQTATQQGDFARTSGGLANQQRILAAEIANAKMQIGQQLLPVMRELVTTIASKILPAVSDFFTRFKEGKTALNPIIDALKGFIGFVVRYKDFLIPIVAGISAVVVAMKTWKAITTALDIAWALLDALLTANPIGLLVLGIVAVTTALTVFFTKTETGRKVFAALKDTFSTAFSAIKTIAIDFANFWIGIIDTVIGAVNLLLDGLRLVTFGQIDVKVGTIPKIGPTTTTPQTATPKATTQTPGKPVAPINPMSSGTFIYNAAPNKSLDSQQELINAVKRARSRSGL